MTTERAQCLQKIWKSKNGNIACLHQRMVDTLESNGKANSQLLVYRECGVMIPDPVLKIGKNNFTKKVRPILAAVL